MEPSVVKKIVAFFVSQVNTRLAEMVKTFDSGFIIGVATLAISLKRAVAGGESA